MRAEARLCLLCTLVMEHAIMMPRLHIKAELKSLSSGSGSACENERDTIGRYWYHWPASADALFYSNIWTVYLVVSNLCEIVVYQGWITHATECNTCTGKYVDYRKIIRSILLHVQYYHVTSCTTYARSSSEFFNEWWESNFGLVYWNLVHEMKEENHSTCLSR